MENKIRRTISPLDNRYYNKTQPVRDYFAEEIFYCYRVLIEIKYLVFLTEKTSLLPKLSTHHKEVLENIVKNFSENDFNKITLFEKQTNHDVKAIEYFLREKLSILGLASYSTFIHLGITSEDTNNLAYGLLLSDFFQKVYKPKLNLLIESINKKALDYSNVVMIGRTHGQSAVPTTLGKEFAVYAYRLKKIQNKIVKLKIEGKLNGAVGNYNALQFAAPEINWVNLSQEFVESLKLDWNPLTTQILSADSYIELFNYISLVNTVLLGLCQDLWRYISDNYLILKHEISEVGSSTMPQKINPIDFENAEGNLETANSLFNLFRETLPVSRLQRDLSDSTIKRNFGVAFGYSILAMEAVISGLDKISANEEKMLTDLNSDWSILSEAIQTLLRVNNYERGFEKTKELTRGKKMNKEDYYNMLSKLKLDKTLFLKLKNLNPQKYLGLTVKLTKLIEE